MKKGESAYRVGKHFEHGRGGSLSRGRGRKIRGENRRVPSTRKRLVFRGEGRKPSVRGEGDVRSFKEKSRKGVRGKGDSKRRAPNSKGKKKNA